MAARARCGGWPIASSTGDGSSVPELQADPVETAIPARSSAVSSVSPSQPSKATFKVLHTRGAFLPATRERGIPSAAACRRSRNAASRGASSGSEAAATESASASPTIPATFSVPPRRPRSWWPPGWSARSARPLRIQSRPAPLGPPILCAESEIRSACSSGSGILPAACTASVWSRTPFRRQSPAISSSGESTPVSLLAAMIEQSRAGKGVRQRCDVEQAVAVDADPHHLSPLAGTEHGGMFDGGDDHPASFRSEAAHREEVRFGSPAGEYDLALGAAERPGTLLAGAVDEGARVLSGLVDRGGVGEDALQRGHHRLEDGRVQRSGRVGVEVDHATSAERAARRGRFARGKPARKPPRLPRRPWRAAGPTGGPGPRPWRRVRRRCRRAGRRFPGPAGRR